jgi:hypothetical protein
VQVKSSQVICVIDESTLAPALSKLDTDCAIGFDLEWKAARMQPKPSNPQEKRANGPVALMQLSDASNVVVISLAKIGSIPDCLVSFLTSVRIAGVNSGGDLKKLSKDYTSARLGYNRESSGVFDSTSIVELVPLAADVLRVNKKAISSLEKLFARCCPGRVLDKKLCHERGPHHVDWEQWPLQPESLQYAANDADAGALIARRLLQPDAPALHSAPAPQTTALPPVPPPLSEVLAGANAFDNLDPELVDGLVEGADDLVGNAPDRSSVDGELEDALSAVRSEPDLPAAPDKCQTVMSAAIGLICAWAESGSESPLRLPKFLDIDDRAELHSFCEQNGWAHETERSHDECADDGLPASAFVVRRRNGGNMVGPIDSIHTNASSVFAHIWPQLQFYEHWDRLRIKYDPRHWMGNWFLMAQSKSSSFFKYFCTATADALYKVQQGSREEVKRHLRLLFKQGAGDAERDRVDTLIRKMRRKYWKKHCEWVIDEPKLVARPLLLVYILFRGLDDPETNRPFFSPGKETST